MKARMATIAVVLGAFGLSACDGGDDGGGGGTTPVSATEATTIAASSLETDDGSVRASQSIVVGPGIRAVEPEGHGQSGAKAARIIGGSPVNIEQFPWQVALAVAPAVADPGTATLDRQFCGGTLVAPTIVVSAAHCLYDTKRGEFYEPSLFTVISGRTKMSSDQGDEVPMAGYRYFADDANRPLYSPALKDWDVVVIELPRPAIGRPLKIAGGDETQSWAAGTSAWVSGWGSTDDGREGTDSDHLLATSVLILGDARCSQVYNFDSQTSLCAGVTVGEHDTCIGDSGGPLVVSLPSGEERLVGATSYGSKDCGNVAAPGVYARLAADPIRSRVQTLVQQLAGVDVVG